MNPIEILSDYDLKDAAITKPNDVDLRMKVYQAARSIDPVKELVDIIKELKNNHNQYTTQYINNEDVILKLQSMVDDKDREIDYAERKLNNFKVKIKEFFEIGNKNKFNLRSEESKKLESLKKELLE